ncbi:MAG: hypothetical protein K2N91_00890 [Muribaculaceae bacterium]|nr:hypothetical protein [Muribaculaceae bacterium]
MEKNHDYYWAELLNSYYLDYKKDGERVYSELVDMIKSQCNGAFGITSSASARTLTAPVAIETKIELPWEYLYECMRRSRKDFCLILPKHLKEQLDEHIVKKENYAIYGWYDEMKDAIHIFAYTGRLEEEENTAPAYDGWGRYDTYYEIVEGYVDKEAKWIESPRCRSIGLYGM